MHQREEKDMSQSKEKITAGESALFCSQVALILQSGVPLHDGITALIGDENASPEAFQKLAATVQETGSLYEAVKSADAFPAYMVNMIRIGERAGKLEQVMRSLSAYYEREDRLRDSLRSAVMYPLVLMVLMAAVIGILAAKVLPVFDQVFAELGGELPALSVKMIQIGSVVGKVVLALMGVFLVVILVTVVVSRLRGGSDSLPEMLLSRGKIAAKMSAGRFASVASMMLSSGYDADEMLEMLPSVLSDKHVIDKVGVCREKIAAGRNFSQAVAEAGIFTGLPSRMLSVGYATGTMDTVMDELASLYEEEIDRSIESFVSVLEPILIAVLSGLIGAVLLSVMLPLMGIMSSIG
jgi:type IV pilus assembly protein PilC